MSGLDVIMNDIKAEFVEKGFESIARILSRNVEKEKISEEEKSAVLGKIKKSVSLKDMQSADYVVEAAIEKEEIKFQLFKDLDEICGDQVILATNTSSIPIGRIARQTKRPEKVIGMHFMNPVPLMQLVEIIPGIATSDETLQTTWNLAEKFGKTPAKANDYPGFIANRILLIGLDTCLAVMETLHDGFKDSKYRPCPLLRKYVEAGWLGRKTGRGFYEYK
jgi:3-hydroxybutyryl-CoA dehydrogenase